MPMNSDMKCVILNFSLCAPHTAHWGWVWVYGELRGRGHWNLLL